MFALLSSWISLRSWREERGPRPCASVGALGSRHLRRGESARTEEASHSCAALSSPSPGQDGERQAGLAPAGGMRIVRAFLLRLPRLRQGPSLLRVALSPERATTQVPRVQPPLPAETERPPSSRGTTGPVSFPSTKTSSESDGSPSCLSSSFWQSGPQETKASRTTSPLLVLWAVGRRGSPRRREQSMSQPFAGNAKPHPALRAPGMDVRAGESDVTDIPWGVAP